MPGVLTLLDQPRTLNAQAGPTTATIFFYESGTSNVANIYADEALTTPLDNPLSLAAGQIFPDVYLDSNINYRRRIEYGDGSVQDVDPIDKGAEALRNTLESTLGASQVGLADGSTVEDRVSETYESLVNDSVSFTPRPDINEINGEVNSNAVVLGGTVTNPNYLSKRAYREVFDSPGSSTLSVSPGFVVNDRAANFIQVNVIRLVDATPVGIFTNNNGLTVTGFGTSTLSITIDSPPPLSGTFVEIVIFDTEDEPLSTLSSRSLNFINGYDSLVSTVATKMFGQHASDLGSSGAQGHNIHLNGSYTRTEDAGYTGLGGQLVFMGNNSGTNTLYSFGWGRFIRAVGTAVFAFGQGINLEGANSNSIAVGLNHYSNSEFYFAAFGRGAYVKNHGSIVQGCGLTADSEPGEAQTQKIVLRLDTTDDSTNQTFVGPTGGTALNIEDESSGYIKVKCHAHKDDYSEQQIWEDIFYYHKTGNLLRIDGSAGDVAVTSIKNTGSTGWVFEVRGASGFLFVYGTGGAGDNVKWIAEVEIAERLT